MSTGMILAERMNPSLYLLLHIFMLLVAGQHNLMSRNSLDAVPTPPSITVLGGEVKPAWLYWH